MTHKVAIVQAPPVLLDRKATIAHMLSHMDEAAAAGAQLVVFPEAYVPGYPTWVWRLKPGGDMVLTLPVGVDAVHRPLHRIYGEKRLPRLLEHWNVREEAYWAKPNGSRFEPVSRERALSEAGSASYYALGLYVVVPR